MVRVAAKWAFLRGCLVASWGLLILALLAAGCSNSQYASLEEEANSINRSLICPLCPGETIDQSQVELAKQMRAMVWEKLEAGETREQILQFFVDRYGISVLAEPPQKGFNLTVWLVPPVVALASGLVLFFVVKGMSRRSPGSPEAAESAEEPDLEAYLSLVDEELEDLESPGRQGRSAIPNDTPVGPEVPPHTREGA